MIIRPELTIDRSGEAATSYEIFAPVYFIEDRHRIARDRPWQHLRYHSSFPIHGTLRDEPPHYETLHLLTLHPEDGVDYFFPHEGHSSEDGFPKTFAFCLENSVSRWHPQDIDEVKEVTQAKRSITKRRAATSWESHDFVTDEPLGVYFYDDGANTIFVAELGSIEFTKIQVRPTKTELRYRRWASRVAAATPAATSAG